MNLYINKNNIIYTGDRQNDDRKLTTEEAELYLAQKEKDAIIFNLKLKIDELDKKRIRAICEPQLKDETTGQTWLEYYTMQIQGIREEISAL